LLDQAVARGSSTSGLFDTDRSFRPWSQVASDVENLAGHLVAAGVEPGDRVCVLHPRSSASFIAVHAILQAGAVMVPLDPFGPTAGLLKVLAAVEPALVIGHSKTIAARLGGHLAATAFPIIHNGPATPLVDVGVSASRLIDFAAATARQQISTPPRVAAADPAYIIFTSGSTGVPKGIVHTHASGLAYAEMGALAHSMTADDRLAAISPLHFDQSTLDLYAVPWIGASAIAISEAELRFPASLSEHLAAEAATMIYTTPYQLTQLMQRGDLTNRDLDSIRQVAFGGEAFAPAVLVELGQAFAAAELLNVYGPAEVNGVTVHSFGVNPTQIDDVSIGHPCDGVSVLIANANDEPVSDGEVGEMLIHSPTAMRGYWQRDDLNAASFVAINGRRFYRTGDLAHLDDLGQLQFHGRRDNLIKVRGVRIELEEIERALEDSPQVAHAVAGRLDSVDGMQHIAAWVVLTDEADLASIDLTSWCRDRLPANAVPTTFLSIDYVPTTATGKIDRATLRANAGKPES